ncbi:MAG: endonuclease Q family protein [Elusimicrobia bacterium]|nr:endonuclease Q family protein [Candidatus Liberimonas magnetica]
MKFIADLHIHSHYSLATSKNLTPEHLDLWAQLKGIDVIATGDCIHPAWLKELKEKLEPNKSGLYRLKDRYRLRTEDIKLPKKVKKEINFILQTELSCIYKKNGKVRKVHSITILPDFASAEKLQKQLEKKGNIESDGRPILGIDAKNILAMTLVSNDKAFVIPAHIWTPWFSVLGQNSGFDSISECYEDLTKYIFALETGLSSDPPMNWACSFLDGFRLVSNSDAHSPEKLGREANIFDTELSYDGVYNALKNDSGFTGTIEFFPEEGKYHFDGHRKCGICFSPGESIKHKGICPVCKKSVTKGVASRVESLSDRKDLNGFKNRKEFYSITSLPSILSEILSCGVASRKVKEAYFDVIDKVGSDFYTLLFAGLDEIRHRKGEVLSEAVKRLRQKKVHIKEGFDGKFGRIKVFSDKEMKEIGNKVSLAARTNPFDKMS